MRIAIVNHGLFPYLLGGMERHTTFLANHLVELGVEVDVLVPEIDPEIASSSQELDFHFQIIELPWPKSPLWLRSNYLFSCHVRQHLLSQTYATVYCQGFNGWAYLTDPSRQRRTRCIYNPHGLEMFKTVGLWQTFKHLPMRYAARVQARHADKVVSLGGHLTEQVRSYLKVDRRRIVVLPNAVDLQYIDSYRQRELKRRPSQFIFVGRLAANKGIETLCRAFSSLSVGNLLVVGSGPLEAMLRQRYKSKQIQFLGNVDDAQLFKLYQESDCFVFASLYEGMPTVILEAMASGLPIIATDIGAVATMVDKTNGFVVAPGSISQLADALSAFHTLNDRQKDHLRACSRQRVEERFTWPIIARATLDLLNV